MQKKIIIFNTPGKDTKKPNNKKNPDTISQLFNSQRYTGLSVDHGFSLIEIVVLVLGYPESSFEVNVLSLQKYNCKPGQDLHECAGFMFVQRNVFFLMSA